MRNSLLVFCSTVIPAVLHAEVPARKAPEAAPVLRKIVETKPGKKADGKAVVDPTLDCEFFKNVVTSPPRMIAEAEDGSLEDIADGRIDAEDVLRVEHTADCVSTSQGEHKETFSDAVATAQGVEISIYGGPAYGGDLKILLQQNLGFTSSYRATYKAPAGPLIWKITRHSLRLKGDKLTPGTRLYGWVSVEFEETDENSGKIFKGKVEGYIKPVIQSGK